MEEDVEIELLYNEHERVLMEAAEATDAGGDVEKGSGVCEEDSRVKQAVSVEKAPNVRRTAAGKKYSKPKPKQKKKSTVKRKKKLMVYEDSATDVEELLDDSIVKHIMARGIHSTLDSDVDNDSCLEDDEGNENCISEILDIESQKERCSGLVKRQVKNESIDEETEEKAIAELISFLNLTDKRHDVLENVERKLKEDLVETEDIIIKTREQSNALEHNATTKLKEPNLSKCFYKKFGMPYFQDSTGYPAPFNDDAKTKIMAGELIVPFLPRLRYWRQRHKDILQDAVQLTLIQENSDKYVKEIDKLKDALENVTDEQTEKKTMDRIVHCQTQLKRIKEMSYLDLVANENPNRQYDWMKYSATDLNEVHSSEECKRFWHLYLKPSINKVRWERSEGEKLKEIAEKMNLQDWAGIARLLGTNRSTYQCIIHYRNRLYDKQDHLAGKWTKEEDEKLLSVIRSAKVGDFIPWTKVSTFMDDRTHNQIYNRYVNCLDPKLVKGRFCREEDLLIVSGIEVFGVSYKEMASLMSNRTPNQVRERYERHLLPKTAKTGSFSVEEDKKLLKLVDKHGAKNFALIANEMKTRSRTQIRQRYNWMMRLMKSKPGWTPDTARRRINNKVSKKMTLTQKKVDKLKREIEHTEKTFKLTKLESEAFRIEKLKELRDSIFLKKYNLKKYKKKKTYSVSSELKSQLIEFFKYQHLNNLVKSSVCQNSLDNVAYLNEILLLAKYFGYDLQLPESEDEIKKNDNLDVGLKTFLVETMKQRAVDAACDEKNVEFISTRVVEPHSINYVEPEVDNTLIMEERWHNASINISNFNFSELFKRIVFDYSHGMHQDIWYSKINRSKVGVLNNVISIATTSNEQQYFFPPNSITTVGYKSVLLSRTRLKRDARKPVTFENAIMNESKNCHKIYQLGDKFQETLLSLFYCPKVLSLTEITATTLPTVNSKSPSSESLVNHEGLVNLLKNSNDGVSDIVSIVSQPIKNDALQAKKMRKNILEHKKTHQRQLQEFKTGITYKRKMDFEHFAKNVKEQNKTFLSTQVKKRTYVKMKSKENNAGLNGKETNKGVNILTAINCKIDNDSPDNKLDSKVFSSSQLLKAPNQTYSRTRQSLKRHLNFDKCSEPATKKAGLCTNLENTTSNLITDQNLCPKIHSRTTRNTK